MCLGILGEGLDPRGGDVRQDVAVHYQRPGLGLRPVAAAGHVGSREGIERYRVARDLWEREEWERVEETLAPPELLGKQEARHPFSRTAPEGEVERRSERQRLAVRQRRRVPTATEHEARAVLGIPQHHRILGVALGEPVPGVETQRISRQHFAVGLASVLPASLEHGLLGKQQSPVRRSETLAQRAGAARNCGPVLRRVDTRIGSP